MSEDREENTTRLERAEHYIYLAAGYILVFAAAGLLVAALIEMTRCRTPGTRHYPGSRTASMSS